MYFLITTALAAAFNRALSDELARFQNRAVAVMLGGRRLVFRVRPDGRLAPAHPLIDADCRAQWQGGRLRVEGDGDMLSALSALLRQTDWAALASECAGPRLAPAVLYRIEQALAGAKSCAAAQTVPAQRGAAYADNIKNLRARVGQAAARISALQAGRR